MKLIARHRRKGFSLVEIVLALGIVTFALVAVFGLVALALHDTKAASDDDTVAFMSQRLAAEFGCKNFAKVMDSTTGYLDAKYRYFDFQGNPVGEKFDEVTGERIEDDTENPPEGTHYICRITAIPGSDIPRFADLDNEINDAVNRANPAALETLIQDNLLYLQFRFSWPAQAAEEIRQKNTVIRTLGKYNTSAAGGVLEGLP